MISCCPPADCYFFLSLFFFFFKQKTAYEMRISDWSSDVCSSDLREIVDDLFTVNLTAGRRWEVDGARIDPAALSCPVRQIVSTTDRIVPAASAFPCDDRLDLGLGHVGVIVSSSAKGRVWRRLSAEGRRGGKGGVSKGKFRGA